LLHFFCTQGLRANLLRLYNSVSDESYNQCKAAAKYQKLLFALTYFHRYA
jgi:dynein heavy chain